MLRPFIITIPCTRFNLTIAVDTSTRMHYTTLPVHSKVKACAMKDLCIITNVSFLYDADILYVTVLHTLVDLNLENLKYSKYLTHLCFLEHWYYTREKLLKHNGTISLIAH